MRIESREFKQEDGTSKKSIIIVCETEEEAKILDTVGQPIECGNYNYKVKGKVRLADSFREFYVYLKPDPHRYFEDELEFLGELADRDECDGNCSETRPNHDDCPECDACATINEAGEILRKAINVIRRKSNE